MVWKSLRILVADSRPPSRDEGDSPRRDFECLETPQSSDGAWAQPGPLRARPARGLPCFLTLPTDDFLPSLDQTGVSAQIPPSTQSESPGSHGSRSLTSTQTASW